jgi:hypothetical protein
MDPRPICPPPFPGEHAFGHAERVNHLNAAPSRHHWSDPSRSRDQSSPLMDWIAQSCNMSALDYAQQHTLLPFGRYEWYANEFDAVRACTPKLLEMSRWTRYGRYAKWCAACAAQDLRKFTISYWRRAHQLPGLVECPQHQCPLQLVKALCRFERSPHAYASGSQCLPRRRPGKTSEVLQRYQAVAVEMLNPQTQPTGRLWMQFGGRVANVGPCLLRTESRSLHIPLAYAKSVLTDAWIDEVHCQFEALRLKRAGRENDVVAEGPTALATALAIWSTSVTDAVKLLHPPKPTQIAGSFGPGAH